MVYLLEMKFQRMSTAKELIIMRLISIFPFLISILFAQVDYNSEIQPIFTVNCISCHDGSHSSGLDLTSYAGVMAGANNGSVIEPGDHSSSELYNRITLPESSNQDMPPNGSLTQTQIANKIVTQVNADSQTTYTLSNNNSPVVSITNNKW